MLYALEHKLPKTESPWKIWPLYVQVDKICFVFSIPRHYDSSKQIKKKTAKIQISLHKNIGWSKSWLFWKLVEQWIISQFYIYPTYRTQPCMLDKVICCLAMFQVSADLVDWQTISPYTQGTTWACSSTVYSPQL